MTVLLIGAGLSGLMAATVLKQQGVDVLLVEKSRGVGGRLATRRISDGEQIYVFDHGAQYFTVRHRDFEVWVEGWIRDGVAAHWSDQLQSTDRVLGQREARYIGLPAMTAIAKHLSAGHRILLNHRVNHIRPEGSGWEVKSDNGQTHQVSAIVSTMPIPQLLTLIEQSELPISVSAKSSLRSVKYHPCLAWLGVLPPENAIINDKLAGVLRESGVVSIENHAVRLITENHIKGIQSAPGAYTVHMDPEFSNTHYEASDEEVMTAIEPHLKDWLDGNWNQVQIKRWRYSQPKTSVPESHLVLQEAPLLVAAGDAFGPEPVKGRVEGAALSGLAAAQTVLSHLNKVGVS